MIKYPCGRILALVIDEEGNAKTARYTCWCSCYAMSDADVVGGAARQEKVKNRCLECVAFGGTQPIKCSAAHQVYKSLTLASYCHFQMRCFKL